MTKKKYLQVRIGEREEVLLDKLTKQYRMNRSALVRFALEYIQKKKPTFQVAPSTRELVQDSNSMDQAELHSAVGRILSREI